MEKKQGITIIAGNETYENLSTFETIDKLNDTVRAYKEKFANQLNKTQLAVLNHLHNHSAKYFGVSFKTKKKIAEALQISRRTVIRVCLRLEIKQLEMKRKSDMKQTSNAIVIQPIIVEEQIVTPEPTTNDDFCHTKKTTTISLKQKIEDINKRNSNENTATPEENIKEADFIAHWVPERFVSLTSSFYSESKTIQELWKVVRQCNKVTNFSTGNKAFTKDQELTIGLKALKAFVMKIKSGAKMKKGNFAYFNGIVNNLMDKFYFDKEFMGI
ncbi:helix-turn-helix domain-containing protein [Bacillus mycoides]|uniref:helix-turn-helix domain-containing protein n=1 Tax=Bacillus mycoides TaxID=1405 RepID=UPI002112ACAB|nr:helix-turn-helix domain-containing protein [Bacillus mycoides]MCQ6530493.1 helix-turn-helix domain-containing protein [Bacillus mycoides]